MKINNGFHSIWPGEWRYYHSLCIPWCWTPYLPPAYPPKSWDSFSTSFLSDSIVWDLPLPAQPSRVISTFSSGSGVTAAYRDCANPNKSSWKALPPSLPPLFQLKPQGLLNLTTCRHELKQKKQVSLTSLERSTEQLEWSQSYFFTNVNTLKNGTVEE